MNPEQTPAPSDAAVSAWIRDYMALAIERERAIAAALTTLQANPAGAKRP